MEAAITLGKSPDRALSPDLPGSPLAVAPSPAEKGLFYPEYRLQKYDSAVDVAGIRLLKETKYPGRGTIYLEEWPMLDEAGTHYKVARGVAEKPVTGVWIGKDTAWSTQVEGANTDIALKLMQLGFNVFVKGPEIGSSIPLSQSAYHTHLMLDALQELHEDVDTSIIALEGYSRGSMIGFGTNAYAAQFGRKILYSNFTDPCVGRPIKIDWETAKKAATLPIDITMLEFDVLRSLADRRRGRHLIKTVDPTPKGFVQFVRTGGPLMNGEAGMMAACTPGDMQATIAFFRRTGVNDANMYRRILADRPGVRFVTPEGWHGGGLDRRIIGNIVVRFGRLGEQLAEGRTPEELYYPHITHGEKLVA